MSEFIALVRALAGPDAADIVPMGEFRTLHDAHAVAVVWCLSEDGTRGDELHVSHEGKLVGRTRPSYRHDGVFIEVAPLGRP